MSVLLNIRGLSKHFGGVAALQSVDLELHEGIITGLLGPNGAGKTTLFNAITGNLAADSGTVELNSQSIRGLSPYRIARLGIARSFQDLRLFGRMTVRENLEAARETSSWLWQPRGQARKDREAAVDLALERCGLTGLASARALDLAYAERKFLSLARIQATGAKIWLLDEPASGLDQGSRKRFVAALRRATAEGVTICLIEHNVDIVSELADRIAFLDRGKKLAEGTTTEIMQNPDLIDIYFGASRR
jgi:branched-chain amino acid transport system ATP-binding protein